MKFIDSHEQKITKDITEKFFDLKGKETNSKDEKIFSKTVSIDLGNKVVQNRYFIRIFNNVPFDPFGPEARREIWNRTDLRQVSQSTFNNYNNYLNTRNRIFLTKTNRSYIDG